MMIGLLIVFSGDISVVLRETTLTISGSIDGGLHFETEIVRVIWSCTTEIVFSGDISVVLRETTLTISGSIDGGLHFETEIVRVIWSCTTEITVVVSVVVR